MLVVERILQILAGHPCRPGEPAEAIQQLLRPLLTSPRTVKIALPACSLKLRAQCLAHGIGDGSGAAGGQLLAMA